MTTATDGVAVSCAGVSLTYGRGYRAVVAVHGISCDIRLGDRIALVGRSGSGKSTLLHLLAGLEIPTTGTIAWPALGPEGVEQPAVGVAGRPRTISVVFQSASLVPALTAVENVELALLLNGVARAEARDRAAEALAVIGVGDLADRLPEELSGGQAQRVTIARGIASDPQLLLADEPTGRLDTKTGHLVVDALEIAADRSGAALVVATHDATVARRMPVRWEMHDGRITSGIAQLSEATDK